MFFRKKNFENKNTDTKTKTYIIAGLGNPGTRFDNTKHNVGFDVIDLLSGKFSIKVSKIKFKSVYGEGKIGGARVILAKPQTFMNLSGESISALKAWYKVPEERIIIVFDDIDIGIGELRVKRNGSAGSHNGMKSVIYQLGKDNFPRVKVGIGPKPEGWDLADYVLSKFTKEEQGKVNKSEEAAVLAIEEMISGDIDSAMNKYNKKI